MLKHKYTTTFVELTFDLFTNKLHKDRDFFLELNGLGISYKTLLEILDNFIKTEATAEQKEKYLYAQKNSIMSPYYNSFYCKYDLLRMSYIEAAKVNFDKKLIADTALKKGYNYKEFKNMVLNYINLFATEEEYMHYLNCEENSYNSKPKNNKYDTILKTVLEKDFDAAIDYINNELNYDDFSYSIRYFRINNPFALNEKDFEVAHNCLLKLRKICYKGKTYRKSINKPPIDKDELAKAKLKEIYLQYKEIVQAYVDGKILAGDLSPKKVLHSYEFNNLLKAVALFDKDLYDKYIEKRNQEEDLNNNYNICLKILECLRKGVNVNGQKDSFTIFDFRILTAIKPNIFCGLINSDLGLTREQIVEIKKFLTKNLELRIIVEPEQVISEKISFLHNGEELAPTIEEKRYVMDYVLSKNMPYVSAYKVALRRYIKYGVINDEVIPYEEPVKQFGF